MHTKSYILYTLLFFITLGGLLYYISQPKVVDVKDQGIRYQERPAVQSTFVYHEPAAAVDEDEKKIERSGRFLLDDFGNYILSEADLESLDEIPVNENGKILYNVYTDESGMILNPMPDYYGYYEEYFEIGHSVFE